MTKEFNLSEKIRSERTINSMRSSLSVTDVKEFIKRLKEELSNKDWKEITNEHAIDLFNTIDKLAGDKLKEEEGK